MKPIETPDLVLRPFRESDLDAVQHYAGAAENLEFMQWGPSTPVQTAEFIRSAMESLTEEPWRDVQLAVILKETGALIGVCGITRTKSEDTGEIGWLVHRDHWGRGYATQMGRALLSLGFEVHRLRRIIARCDAENTASFRVMEKIGMRKEGIFLEAREPGKNSDRAYGDEIRCAVLREEWEIQGEVEQYNALPVHFSQFIHVPELTDGDIRLICTQKQPAIPEKKYVPAYQFAVCRDGEAIGEISLRIGYVDGLYYGGQIGYTIHSDHRGKGYAGAACRLVLPVARAHGMKTLLITNDQSNHASRRVCEKLGASHVRLARLPQWHPLYQEGGRFINIYSLPTGL